MMSLEDQRRGSVQAQDQRECSILTLPPEITSEIFVQCLKGQVHPAPLAAPLIFLAICRSWHAIAVSTPALWAELNLNFSRLPLAPGKVAEIIIAWFSRAGTLPLSFRTSTLFLKDQESLKFGLRTVIHGYAARLQVLRVYGNPHILLGLPSGAVFPLLRKLDLGSWSSFIDEPPIEAFQMVPLLQTLSLDTVPPAVLKIPWEQLTHVVASNIGVAVGMSVLRSAPYLRQFCLNGPSGHLHITDTPNPGPPLLHSHLLLLELRYAEELIPLLTLPALEKFDISGAFADIFPLRFISSPSLQTFTFGTSTPAVSLRWIQHMEHLTTLELNSPKWPHKDELIRTLNRAHQPQFLPKLRSLALLQCESKEVTESLLEALHSRAGPVDEGFAVLRQFRLQWPYYAGYEGTDAINRRRSSIHTDEMEKLVARGMEIYVGTGDKNYF
ncbi:hypothetical protein C8J57DRAFT_1536162 [Mycena rebaudengoi]|nr:hypothetical protein C8J57DRAFT_1536162 [Mycena rebaudengoi]